MTVTRLAIDPYDCGCIGCITGEHVPVESARTDDVAGFLLGRIADHSGSTWQLTSRGRSSTRVTGGGRIWEVSLPIEVLRSGGALDDEGRAVNDSAEDLRHQQHA